MSDLFDGKSLGEAIGDGLEELVDALKHDPKSAPRKFNCRTISLELTPTEYSPELVKKTRQILGASQVIFARFLGVSPNTVRAWEQGTNLPMDSACRFMDEIRANPRVFRQRLLSFAVKKPGRTAE
jgi:putative transcriptional regulator